MMADKKGLYTLFIDLRASIDGLSKDLGQATSLIQNFGQKTIKVTDGIRGAFGADLYKGLKQLATYASDAIPHLAQLGEEASGIRGQFENLGGSQGAIKRAGEALRGTVSEMDLMRAANEGLLKNIPQLNERFADMADFAGRFAEANGKDTVDVLNQITDAMGKGTVKAFRDFGIYIDETGTKLGNQNAAMAALLVQMSRLAPETTSVANAQKAWSIAIEDAQRGIGEGINNSSELAGVYAELAKEVKKIDWVQVGTGIGQAAAAVGTLIVEINKALPIAQQFANVVNSITAISNAFSGQGNYEQKLYNSIADVDKQMADNRWQKGQPGRTGGLLNQWLHGDLDAKFEALKQEKENYLHQLDSILMAKYAQNKPAVATVTDWSAWQGGWKDVPGSHRPHPIIKPPPVDKPEIVKAVKEASEESSVAVEKDLTEAYENSVETWRGLFENAITGVTFNLEDALKQVAVGFAAEIAQGVIGSLGGVDIKSPADIGSFIGKSILGELGLGGGGIAAGAGGNVPPGAEGLLGGAAGSEIMAAAGPIAAAALAIFAAKSGFDGYKAGAGQGLVGGARAGWENSGVFRGSLLPIIGGAIGGLFGGGPQNKDTQSRNSAISFLSERLGHDVNGGGSDRFNPGKGGFDYFNQLDAKAKQTYGALGDAIKETLGITEDVGPQIAAILAEDLGGSADKARQAFRKLGMSLPDLEQAFIELGKKGKQTWLEIVSDIHGVEEAAAPGVAGLGDMKGAMDNLTNSGAKGVDALYGVRDVFVEAGEAGVNSFDAMAAKFGNIPGLDKVIQSAKDLGLSFDEMTKLTDRQGAEMVAHLQAIGFAFTEIADKASAATDAVNEFNGADVTDKNLSVDTAGTDIPQFAMGGVFDRPTVGMFAESGPEAVLPLTRKNGKLGVMSMGGMNGGAGGVHIHVDARGAAPGVEHAIKNAVREAMNHTTSRVMDQLSRDAGRRAGRA
jgi:hypothetical protein